MAKRSRENNDMTSDNDDSNEDMAPTSKYTQLEADGETLPTVKITCSLPPHVDNIPFSSYEAYEAHYRANHVNRCSECHKVLPTEHFLALHIAENHDPMNEAKRARGEKTVIGPKLFGWSLLSHMCAVRLFCRGMRQDMRQFAKATNASRRQAHVSQEL